MTKEHFLNMKAFQAAGFLFGFLFCSYYFYFLWDGTLEGDNSPFLSVIANSTGVVRVLSESGLLIAVSLIMIVPHELLHAVGFLPGCGWQWRGNMKFGFSLKKMVAYCHCPVPMRRVTAMVAVLLPFIVLSVMTLPLSILLNMKLLLLACILNAIGSMGDLIIAYMLLREKPDYVIDHPTECGFTGVYKSV